MGFIINHWHCILPIGGILIALIFMREKPNNKSSDNNKNDKSIENIENV
jgi:hypothetical protein